MTAQLRQLAALAAMPDVTVQILPAIAHPATASGFVIAVLDEYLHHLRSEESTVIMDDEHLMALARRARDAVSMRPSRYEGFDPDDPSQPISFRSRFALRYGSKRQDVESARQPQVRNAFNSPFWPFVLTTTSVGQEGIDFHWWCHAVVHWNLPANPVSSLTIRSAAIPPNSWPSRTTSPSRHYLITNSNRRSLGLSCAHRLSCAHPGRVARSQRVHRIAAPRPHDHAGRHASSAGLRCLSFVQQVGGGEVSVASEYDHAEQVVADVVLLHDMAAGRLDEQPAPATGASPGEWWHPRAGRSARRHHRPPARLTRQTRGMRQ
jgi:hypothetical protein